MVSIIIWDIKINKLIDLWRVGSGGGLDVYWLFWKLNFNVDFFFLKYSPPVFEKSF
jgi:hypothetical protein